MNGDLWRDESARAFSVRRALDRIESAAHGCGVFAGRWCVGTDERAVRVRHADHLWLVYPDPDGKGWIAAAEAPDGRVDLSVARRLRPTVDETEVPTQAWAELLAGIAPEPALPVAAVAAPATGRVDRPIRFLPAPVVTAMADRRPARPDRAARPR